MYSIALAIEHRTTSKAEDVPLCVTSLLGKDMAPILAADDLEGRMANFYVLVREIPLGILWARATGLKKLTAAPFRWAPCSLARWLDAVMVRPGLITGWGSSVLP